MKPSIIFESVSLKLRPSAITRSIKNIVPLCKKKRVNYSGEFFYLADTVGRNLLGEKASHAGTNPAKKLQKAKRPLWLSTAAIPAWFLVSVFRHSANT